MCERSIRPYCPFCQVKIEQFKVNDDDSVTLVKLKPVRQLADFLFALDVSRR